MKRILYLSLLLMPLGMAGQMAQGAPNAGSLLQSLDKAEKTLSYSGTAVITHGGGAPKTIQVWHSGPKRRLEWLSPAVNKGDVLVDNGQTTWHYFHKERSAVQTRGATEIDWNRLARSMNANVAGSAKIAGRDTWIVNLTPRDKSQAPLKVWIDQKNAARLRVERGNGASKTTMALQKVQFGPVPASRFQWSPPAGARVTKTSGTLYADISAARRAASWLSAPQSAPSGYTFESAVVDTSGNGGKGEAWLRYANGINRFSIFQQRTGDNVAVKTQKAGGGWFAQHGGSRYLVLGLSESEARRVLDSLK